MDTETTRTYRFRLVGFYSLDLSVAAPNLSAAKEMVRREDVPPGTVTPQEMGRLFLTGQGGWGQVGVDAYMSALTDVAPNAPIYAPDYDSALLVREIPYEAGPEQTYRFTLTRDGQNYTAEVSATSVYGAVDQILDGAALLMTDEETPVEMDDETLALFAMLTPEQTSYEQLEMLGEAVAYEVVAA